MDKHQEFGPQLLWDVLANRSHVPLDNLLRWVTGTMVGLVAWSLFVHSPLPLVPAAALLWCLRTYHRQTHPEQTAPVVTEHGSDMAST